MSTSIALFVDTSSFSPVGRLHPMSGAATWLANLSGAPSDHRYKLSLPSSVESVPTYVSLLYPSQGVIVFCLASVFFGLSLALFAICTGLVDVDLRLQDAYIRYILLLDWLCNRYLKMLDAAGEVILVTPPRITSTLADTVVAFSRAALCIPHRTLRILGQNSRLPHHPADSIVNLVHVARLDIKAKALTICAFSRELVEQLCHTVLHATHHLPVDSTRTCLFVAKWMYARGRSLHAAICAGATRAIAIATRLPSRRTYSRAWGGVVRPRPMPYQPAAGQLHHEEAVLSWRVHHSGSPTLRQAVDAVADVSFNITLDLDIDEDGDLRVAVVPETSVQRPIIMPRILCDAATQTEDQGSRTEEQMPMEDPENDTILGLSLAARKGGRELENMNSLALITGVHASLSVGSHVPASPIRAFTFNPHAPSFAPVRPVSPPSRHIVNGHGDSPGGTRLDPLVDEFNAPALPHDVFPADALGLDIANTDCHAGDLVLPPNPKSETDVPTDIDILSPLPLDALTFGPTTLKSESGCAMAEEGEGTGEIEVSG